MLLPPTRKGGADESAEEQIPDEKCPRDKVARRGPDEGWRIPRARSCGPCPGTGRRRAHASGCVATANHEGVAMRAGQFRLPEERPRRRWPILVAGFVACVGAAIAVVLGSGIDFGSGALLTSAREGQSREEIQAELDREVAKNMMTVSVLPNLKLDESTHELQVGLENVGDNTFAQRFVITQGDTCVYESDPLMPGERIETVRAPKAKEGTARVEVQALDAETLEDHGSPTAIEVEVIPVTNLGAGEESPGVSEAAASSPGATNAAASATTTTKPLDSTAGTSVSGANPATN